ncbi:hypothetical protein CTAYLR_000593 [Chrysophaeum taylorii]|uniref:Uncharacterized protein n=1 Tax=Chrysophaeum taylorii TaxID=2483200 RepID=A0AAD7XNF8_9STRA|nr:hypothetical protein CTAYLR_000593 [Chrysophaeum taylorii]
MLAVDDAKALALRRRNEARVGRLLDAKRRTIGIDVGALDAQVAEKEERRSREEGEERLYHEYESRVAEAVAAREAADAETKEEALRALRDEWLGGQRKVGSEDAGTDFLEFAGEDAAFEEREKQLAAQSKRRFDEQAAEKQERVRAERDEEVQYSLFERAVARRRFELDAIECDRRKATIAALAASNADDARAKASKRDEIKAQVARIEAMEIAAKRSEAHLCEWTGVCSSVVAPHRHRPDHFKGLSKEERREILMSNDDLIREKITAKAQRDDEERAYDDVLFEQTAIATHRADLYDMERRRHRTELKEEHYQRMMVPKKKQEFGSIEPNGGFYSGFGRSAR